MAPDRAMQVPTCWQATCPQATPLQGTCNLRWLHRIVSIANIPLSSCCALLETNTLHALCWPAQVYDEAQKDYEVARHALFFNDTGSRELYKDYVSLTSATQFATKITRVQQCAVVASWSQFTNGEGCPHAHARIMLHFEPSTHGLSNTCICISKHGGVERRFCDSRFP